MSGPWLGHVRAESVRLKNLELGGINVETPIIRVFPSGEAPDAAEYMVLGNSFLRRFKTVTFDYPDRKVIFEPTVIASKSAEDLYGEGVFILRTIDGKKR